MKCNDTDSFQYTGRENDGTGLYYYRARYYSPTLQRFISEDPIELNGGINFYAYVENSPANWYDPFGLDRLINPHPGGANGPTITFNNDVPGGPSTNLPVSDATADMIEKAVVEAGYDVNINSTTGGTHEPGSRHPFGRAVDINEVGGVPVNSSNFCAKRLQDIFDEQDNIRENFGPFRNEKTLGTGDVIPKPKMARKHRTHIHVSGQE